MAHGEQDADGSGESARARGPLPPEDRVWRHPAEVAMESRAAAAHRRTRRRRTSTTIVGGVAAAAGLLWLSQAGTTTTAIRSDLTPNVSVPQRVSPTTTTIALSRSGDGRAPVNDADGVILVRDSLAAPPLAGAFMIRDGFLVTSGLALGETSAVILTWDEITGSGVVIGHDEVTDLVVIAVEGAPPQPTSNDNNEVSSGDEIRLVIPSGDALHVVAAASTSAMKDGEPVVGVVELDGTIGATPPGSPAFDDAGAVVGITSATANDAPAAIIPIELARVVADEIIESGTATHPRLGVTARNPDGGSAIPNGSLVTDMVLGGPAQSTGIEVGDLITRIDATPVTSMESMVATLRTYEPGDQISVAVDRDGTELIFAVDLESQA